MMPQDQILEEVAAKHRVGIKDILGPSHVPHIVAARREVCFRMRTELTFAGRPYPLKRIGQRVGRHHASVLAAIRHHEQLMIARPA